MKWQDILSLGLLLLSVMTFAGCGAASQPVEADPGGATIELSTTPDPPVAGEVTLMVSVKDTTQQAVDGADVTLLASHDAMATMLVQQKAESTGSGQYRATFDFSRDNQGDWRVTVEVRNIQPQTIRKNFVISIP
ncbi:MAG: FixH family protein [Caldilinea sp.]